MTEAGLETSPTLVTILGTQAREAEYILADRSCRAPLAPVAIVQLRGGIGEVVALCTERARLNVFPTLQTSLPPDLAERIHAISIPEVTSEGEMGEFLGKVAEVMTGQRVVLDLTHGLRHLAAMAFLAAVYLSALGRTHILEVYYGFLRPETSSPLLKLAPLLELVTLAFAADHFRRTGSPSVLVDRLREDSSKDAEMIAAQLRGLGGAFASGLPLELGCEAAAFLGKWRGRLAQWVRKHGIPLAEEFVEVIAQGLEPYSVERVIGRKDWKRGFVLSRDELNRQARFIDGLLGHEAVGPALMAMEEWALSWTLLQMGATPGWLERETRERAARALHALAAHIEDPILREGLTPDQAHLARWWQALIEVRNALAHAAMRPEEVAPWRRKNKLGKQFGRVTEGWKWLQQFPDVSVRVSSTFGRLLVTPLGRIPGAFYSAVSHARPVDACLCICSEETRHLVAEVLDRVGPPRPEVTELPLADPYRDVAGAEGAARRCRHLLAKAEEVVVNLTGGTTLMGLAVERIGQEAARLGRRVRRVVVLDVRSRWEQEQDPYVVGQAVWLDSAGD